MQKRSLIEYQQSCPRYCNGMHCNGLQGTVRQNEEGTPGAGSISYCSREQAAVREDFCPGKVQVEVEWRYVKK